MSDTRKPVHLIASAIWGIVWISSFGVGLKSYVEFRQNDTIQWNGAQFRDRGAILVLAACGSISAFALACTIHQLSRYSSRNE